MKADEDKRHIFIPLSYWIKWQMCVAKSQFQWLISLELNNQSIYFNFKELKNCSKYERVQSKKGISAQRVAELLSFLVNALSRAISRSASIWRRLDLLFFMEAITILFPLPYSSNLLWGGGGCGSEHALTLRIKPTQKLNLVPIYFLFYVDIKWRTLLHI